MSNPSRCHDCNHRRGPRSTGPLAKAGHAWTNRRGEHKVSEVGVPKKPSCICGCHQ